MKKIRFFTLITLLGVFLTGVNISLAALPPVEMELAYLTLDNTLADVERMYGQPTSKKECAIVGGRLTYNKNEFTKNSKRLIEYSYNGIFVIRGWAAGPQQIYDINLKANNLTTAKGIRVGSSLNELKKAYGKEDYLYANKDGSTTYYYSSGSRTLDFTVQKNIVKSISLYSNT